MWTPRPVRPLRYAGSVATSVLPSPVAISAILPSWRTMPPISWTSKGRMPTLRRAASRATAKASGSSASTDSPASRRFLNSSVFARNSASPSAWTDGSSAFVASTVGIMRLTSRSCLVPKIFRRIASIITIDYGISRDSRPPFARSGCAEQLARVAARGVGDPLAREHARDLRSEEHTSELQSHSDLVCRLLLEKKKKSEALERLTEEHLRALEYTVHAAGETAVRH